MSTQQTKDGESHTENDPTGFYAEARNRLEKKPIPSPRSDATVEVVPSPQPDQRRHSSGHFNVSNKINPASFAGFGQVGSFGASSRQMEYDPRYSGFPDTGPVRSASRGGFGPGCRSDPRASGAPYPPRHQNPESNQVSRVFSRHQVPAGYRSNYSPGTYSGYGHSNQSGMYSMSPQARQQQAPYSQPSRFQPLTNPTHRRQAFQSSPATAHSIPRHMAQQPSGDFHSYNGSQTMNGGVEDNIAAGEPFEEDYEDDNMNGDDDEGNESDLFVQDDPNGSFRREDSESESVPQQMSFFNAPGRNLRPSRFSGVATPIPGEIKSDPDSDSDYEIDDAAAIKRRSKHPSERVSKNASGATDPENILIINLYEVSNKEWVEIADILNMERMKLGKKANVTENAVRLRYNRVAPIIYKTEGKEFISIAKRKELKKTKRGAPGIRMAELLDAQGDQIEPVWNDQMDLQLARIVKDYEAAKWHTVAYRLFEATGVELSAEACNLRFSSAF